MDQILMMVKARHKSKRVVLAISCFQVHVSPIQQNFQTIVQTASLIPCTKQQQRSFAIRCLTINVSVGVYYLTQTSKIWSAKTLTTAQFQKFFFILQIFTFRLMNYKYNNCSFLVTLEYWIPSLLYEGGRDDLRDTRPRNSLEKLSVLWVPLYSFVP